MSLYLMNALRFGYSAGGYSWFSQTPMLDATSKPRGASANQPRKARKNEIVAPQKALMCGFWARVPLRRQRTSSVALLFSLVASTNSGIVVLLRGNGGWGKSRTR